uniref:Uncharacterized protein n=1 Tax=viral metagenome TaxID=1070528 RepID=A0A6C0E1M6_9ZZZZ
MTDKCSQPQEIKLLDIFTTADQLAKASGADQKCKTAISSLVKDSSTSGSVGTKISALGGLLGSAEMQAKFGTKDFENSLNQTQEGCGTYINKTNNIINQKSKIQCIIKESMTSVDSSMTNINSINIKTIPLTSEEIQARTESIKDISDTFKTTIQTARDLASFMSSDEKKTVIFSEAMQIATKSKKTSEEQITRQYDRSATLVNAKLKQTITATMKTQCVLSTESKNLISDAAKQITEEVTKSTLEQTLGASAQQPNVREMINNTSQNVESTSSSDIENTVKKVGAKMSSENTMEISIAGNLNMDGVVIDQDIVATLISDAIISDAMSKGVMAASDILSKSENLSEIVSKSKGQDDLIRESGEGAAKLANAGGFDFGDSGGLGSLFSSLGSMGPTGFKILGCIFLGLLVWWFIPILPGFMLPFAIGFVLGLVILQFLGLGFF